MQRDNIGAGEQFVEGNAPFGNAAAARARGNKDLHVEGPRNALDAARQFAVTDQPERHRRQLAYRVCNEAEVLGLRPGAVAHVGCVSAE